jgi:SAM-dependent methyltransferase
MTDSSPIDLKAKHRAMWALGDYPTVATEVIPELGRRLVQTRRIGPGQRVLDIAAGSGNAAIPAAEAGADVVASDLTPELFEAGRRLAAARGVNLQWQVADAEALPFADAEFDAVISCVGVYVRTVPSDRRGRTGASHQAGRDDRAYQLDTHRVHRADVRRDETVRSAAPAGAQPPLLWGDKAHVRSLLGNRVTDLELRREKAVIDRFADGIEFRDFFKTNYGPTVAVYKAIAAEPGRIAVLDRKLADLAVRHDLGNGRMEWEYLLVTARRR